MGKREQIIMIDISGHLRDVKSEYGFEDTKNHITVNCAGYQKFISRNFSINRKNGRADYQIIYIINGKGNYVIDNEHIQAGPGQMILYKPDEEQKYWYSFSENPEVYWIHFTGQAVKEVLVKADIYCGSIYHTGINSVLIDLFRRIINELQIKKDNFELLAGALFIELASYIGRLYKTAGSDSHISNEKLQNVIAVMHSEYNLKYSAKEYARQCNLSISRFNHLFKELTGVAPMEYLISIRIEKAMDYLLDSSLNISEIADITGYSNPLYFSRIFKKRTGKSPSDYRKTITRQRKI